MDEQENVIMTIEDVAEYLQLHPLTVRRLARENQLPLTKIGRQWRTSRQIMDAWFERESMKNVVRPAD